MKIEFIITNILMVSLFCISFIMLYRHTKAMRVHGRIRLSSLLNVISGWLFYLVCLGGYMYLIIREFQS